MIGGRGLGQFRTQVREVRVRLDGADFCGFDEREQPRAGRSAGDGLAEEPPLPFPCPLSVELERAA